MIKANREFVLGFVLLILIISLFYCLVLLI